MVHNVIEKEKMFYLGETLLMTVNGHNEPQTDLSHPDEMHAALYDFHQMNDTLKHGDVIETPIGKKFIVNGIHVERY